MYLCHFTSKLSLGRVMVNIFGVFRDVTKQRIKRITRRTNNGRVLRLIRRLVKIGIRSTFLSIQCCFRLIIISRSGMIRKLYMIRTCLVTLFVVRLSFQNCFLVRCVRVFCLDRVAFSKLCVFDLLRRANFGVFRVDGFLRLLNLRQRSYARRRRRGCFRMNRAL